MSEDFFDVQAALLYKTAPKPDPEKLVRWCREWAQHQGLDLSFDLVALPSDPQTMRICGSGMHATIVVNNQPLDKKTFSLAFRSPILRHKKFDFKKAIAQHGAGVIVTVGDGDTPTTVDKRTTLAKAGLLTPVDSFQKLQVLNMLMQGLATAHPPLMADFCPSQSLLSPHDISAVASMSLPVPILFHPFPVSNGRGKDRKARMGMAALHSALLIGADLELEAVPKGMSIEDQIAFLATIITDHLYGELSLADGDTFQHQDGQDVWVRHEPGAGKEGPKRIVVSFAPRPEDKPQEGASGGQQAFQDRIARLKSKSSKPAGLADTPDQIAPAAALSGETEDELRERIQDTISPGRYSVPRGGLFSSSYKLAAVAVVVGLFVVLGPSGDLTRMLNVPSLSLDGVMQSLGESQGTSATGTTRMVNTIHGTVSTTKQP